MPRKIRTDNLGDVIKLYELGNSAEELTKIKDVSPGAIKRFLTKNGIKIRTKSEAAYIWNSTHSINTRAIRTGFGPNNPAFIALGKERTKGVAGRFEIEIIEELAERGYITVHQFAWDSYNIDIVFGNFAVEITGATNHPTHIPSRQKRIVKLINAGWTVIYVWIFPHNTFDRFAIAEQLISIFEKSERNPTSLSKYWVIRGSGQFAPVFSERRNSHPLIPALKTFIDPT